MDTATEARTMPAHSPLPDVAAGFRPRPFRPARWLPGPHAQTLGGRLLRRRTAARYRRERWTTPDGDFLDLDWWVRPDHDADPVGQPLDGSAGPSAGPVVVVLHGLEGCSQSGYVVETCRRLARQGLRAVGLNFRSRSGEPNRTRRFYHSGETGDLGFVLDRLRDRVGGFGVGAVGYSLGGNVLLKYLGERGEEARRRVDAAVAVSVPYHLAESARRMEHGIGPLYATFFLRSLRRSLREKMERRGHEYDLQRLSTVSTLREFDEAFTAPVHGFDGARDYYRRSSAARYLGGIRVPTLLLQARDDPFLSATALPEEAMDANPWLLPGVTDRGGHVGFVERSSPWNPRFWAERESARYLRRALPGPERNGPDPGEDRAAGSQTRTRPSM